MGPDAIDVRADGVRLRPGTRVDLGGFAKGWTLDRLVEDLESAGVRNAFLSFGQSSIHALGTPRGDTVWRVLVRGPDGGIAAQPVPAVNIEDRKLAEFTDEEIEEILKQAGFRSLLPANAPAASQP